jgi:hypothetical protein
LQKNSRRSGSSGIRRGFCRRDLDLLGDTAWFVAVAAGERLAVTLVVMIGTDNRPIAVPARSRARIVVAVEPVLDDDRDVLVDRARVRLLLLDAKLRQHVEDHVRFDL